MNFGVPTVVPWIFGDTELVDNTEVVVGVDTREGSGINTGVGFVGRDYWLYNTTRATCSS